MKFGSYLSFSKAVDLNVNLLCFILVCSTISMLDLNVKFAFTFEWHVGNVNDYEVLLLIKTC